MKKFPPEEIIFEVNPAEELTWKIDKRRYDECCKCEHCQPYIFKNYWEAWAYALRLTAEDAHAEKP